MSKSEKYGMLVKAGLSMTAPGAFFVSILNDYQAKIFQERYEEKLENLRTELNDLVTKVEEQIIYENRNNKDYYDLISFCMSKFFYERTKTKRDAYRCVLLNCSKIHMSDYNLDIAEKTIKIIDSLTRTELIVLYNLKDTQSVNQDGEKELIELMCKKSNLNIEELKSIAKSLESNYLLESFSVIIDGPVVDEEETFYPARVYTEVEKYITDLGTQVIEFILNDSITIQDFETIGESQITAC